MEKIFIYIMTKKAYIARICQCQIAMLQEFFRSTETCDHYTYSGVASPKFLGAKIGGGQNV